MWRSRISVIMCVFCVQRRCSGSLSLCQRTTSSWILGENSPRSPSGSTRRTTTPSRHCSGVSHVRHITTSRDRVSSCVFSHRVERLCSRLRRRAAVFARRPQGHRLSRFLQLLVVSGQQSVWSVRQTSETTLSPPAGQNAQQHLQQER